MPPQVRILTDAVADVPRDVLLQHRIGVLPVYLMLNGHCYRDDGCLDRDWFYGELARVNAKPTTAAPSPADYLEAFDVLVAEGAEEILILTAASTVSSLYNHALLAAQAYAGAQVHVVDTLQVSMGAGWLVMEAARLVQEGLPVPAILDRLQSMRARTVVYGVLDSIDYLRRSGRVGWIASSMASLLQIRPVIAFQQGEAKSMGRVRPYRRGVRSLLDLVSESLPLAHVALLHSRAEPAMVEQCAEGLHELLPSFEIPVVDIGGAFAIHVGPRCLGVALVRTL